MIPPTDWLAIKVATKIDIKHYDSALVYSNLIFGVIVLILAVFVFDIHWTVRR